MSDRNPLRLAALACHVLLLIASAALLYRTFGASPWRELGAALAAGPLLLTLAGLRAGRGRTEQWLALWLVVYAGVAAMEVVASAGATRLASVALFASVVELAILLTLNRRSAARARAARE